jgi:DNA-binding CsgD family transcriptional regulator
VKKEGHKDDVFFGRNEREVGKWLLAGGDPKVIAGGMEIAIGTVYKYINGMCARVRVLDQQQLVLWILQHPSCLFQGVGSVPGLHIEGCECGSGGCLGRLTASLPPDEAEKLLRRGV